MQLVSFRPGAQASCCADMMAGKTAAACIVACRRPEMAQPPAAMHRAGAIVLRSSACAGPHRHQLASANRHARLRRQQRGGHLQLGRLVRRRDAAHDLPPQGAGGAALSHLAAAGAGRRHLLLVHCLADSHQAARQGRPGANTKQWGCLTTCRAPSAERQALQRGRTRARTEPSAPRRPQVRQAGRQLCSLLVCTPSLAPCLPPCTLELPGAR